VNLPCAATMPHMRHVSALTRGHASMFISIDRRGTYRLTICIGPWALKLARGTKGRRCNGFEAALWKTAKPDRRNILCPVLARFPFDLCLVMRRARPITEQEYKQLKDTRGFPDWDYVPPCDIESPLEHKASDWGRLSDGRLVALDYAAENPLDGLIKFGGGVR
jgi:hypothetical protein